MTCRICAWLSRRFGPDCDAIRNSISDRSEDWERADSNEYELWCEQSARNRELVEKGGAILDSDPGAAFQLYLEAAEAGSVWAMEVVGWHYHTGTAVVADFGQAQAYYYRALCAGSWMATIRYARLLVEHGYFDHCEGVLEDGVRKNFTPAYFWLAWFRYKRSKTDETCREIRPLLEYAAGKGHPEAKLMIARLMARGRFGIRNVPAGFRRLVETAASFSTEQAGDGDPRHLAA